jgi:hypothetical protein
MSKQTQKRHNETEEAINKYDLKEVAKQFIRVGDDFYKITKRPDKKEKLHKVLAKRSRTTITDDYTNGIIYHIPKYEDFVMVPSHVNYQQVIYGHYNKYHELSHKPAEGSIENIIKFLTHIFGRPHLDFILDYFQLLYLRPTQNLPIILLESIEKNTGKSTFGHFVEKMFQFNAVALGNNDLNSQFNSVWIDKLMIIVDETSLEEKAVMESIKRLSTEKGQVLSNSKGKDKVNVEFIGKFIFISNDEGKALPIQRGEKRFAVFKVPTFQSQGIKDDPDFLSKLESEIPAFLHYLKGRTLVHENRSRMYFDADVYSTDQLKIYFEGNIGYISKSIQNLIQDTFDMFPEENTLSFSIRDILKELVPSYTRFADKKKIKDALENEIGIKPNKKGRYTYISLSSAESEKNYYPEKNNSNNVYYVFERSKFRAESLNNTIVASRKVEQMPVFNDFGTSLEQVLEHLPSY